MDKEAIRIMIAGVGNILIQDDGFGVQVIRELRSVDLPPQVEVVDFGISGIRMAHRLMEGYDLLIIVDIARRGGKPGTIYLIDVDPAKEQLPIQDLQQQDMLASTHTMGSQEVFSLMNSFNAWPRKVVLVCCEPLFYQEYEIGLSEPVQNSIGKAIELIQSVISKELNAAGSP